MRDYLDAISSRVVVFDGGWARAGAVRPHAWRTTAGCRASATRRWILHRPDVIEGVHTLDGRIGCGGRRDRHLPGQPAQARRVGSRATTRSRSTARRPRSRARPSARSGSSRGRSARPATCPPRATRPSAGSRSASSRGLRRAGPGAARGRRRPADHRDRAGHPRGQGVDLRRAERRSSAVGRRRADPGGSVSLLPQGGEMRSAPTSRAR